MLPMTPAAASPSSLHILEHVFGYTAFRGEQEAIVEHVAAGGDALVLMPTGGGKSLCFQIPALLRAGTAVVVSPLIALMQDQVEALRELGATRAARPPILPPARPPTNPPPTRCIASADGSICCTSRRSAC